MAVSCWWNFLRTPLQLTQNVAAGALTSAKRWVNQTPGHPCAQFRADFRTAFGGCCCITWRRLSLKQLPARGRSLLGHHWFLSFNIFHRSPGCLQAFGKLSGKKKKTTFFFYPRIVLSQTFCKCWPSETLYPIQEQLPLLSQQLVHAVGGLRRENLEKSLWFQGRVTTGQPRAMRTSNTVVNWPQYLSSPLFSLCEYYLLIRRGRNN